MDEKDKDQVRLDVWESLQGVWKRKVLWQVGVRKWERKNWEEGCYVLQLSLMLPTDIHEKWTSFFFVQMYCAFLMPLFQCYMQHKFS